MTFQEAIQMALTEIPVKPVAWAENCVYWSSNRNEFVDNDGRTVDMHNLCATYAAATWELAKIKFNSKVAMEKVVAGQKVARDIAEWPAGAYVMLSEGIVQMYIPGVGWHVPSLNTDDLTLYDWYVVP